MRLIISDGCCSCRSAAVGPILRVHEVFKAKSTAFSHWSMHTEDQTSWAVQHLFPSRFEKCGEFRQCRSCEGCHTARHFFNGSEMVEKQGQGLPHLCFVCVLLQGVAWFFFVSAFFFFIFAFSFFFCFLHFVSFVVFVFVLHFFLSRRFFLPFLIFHVFPFSCLLMLQNAFEQNFFFSLPLPLPHQHLLIASRSFASGKVVWNKPWQSRISSASEVLLCGTSTTSLESG